MSTANNKQNVKYKCPFCDSRFTRDDLVIHVDKKHDDMIPEGYSAFRVVFDYVNKKPAGYNGKCIICGEESGWNEEKGKYNRICDNPECKSKYINKFESNMMKTKGTTRISSTAEGQAKMLANRKISGKYKFADGIERTYTGTYERKTLEFMDKVLGCKGEDVITPGPIMEYMFEGKKHIYIPDIYYAPYNLIIEVKDGGDNPNNRNMPSYRAKQIAKEEYIIKNTDFNYLRLTNNNFAQLLSIFAELKMQMVDDSQEGSRVIRINEEDQSIQEMMNGLTSGYMPGFNGTYIVNYMQNNVFSNPDNSKWGISDNIRLTNIITRNKDGILSRVDNSILKNKIYKVFAFNKSVKEISELLAPYMNTEVSENFLYEKLTGKTLYTSDQVYFDENFKEIDTPEMQNAKLSLKIYEMFDKKDTIDDYINEWKEGLYNE